MIFQIQYEFNSTLVNYSVSTFNDGIHDTVVSSSTDLYEKIFNIYCSFEIRVAESPSDTKYQRILYRTSMDMKRILQGVRGNMMTSLIVDNILQKANFDFKLPLEPVQFAIDL